MHRIVIVGGGAGGLELATRLGDKFGGKFRRDRLPRAAITLVDRELTHVWKPLLHEIAAGTLDAHDQDLDYLAQARWHGFAFRWGRLLGVDRAARRLRLAPVLDEAGAEIVPPRELAYDTLVLALGSVGNDFGIPGARAHCYFLDSRAQADRFRLDLFKHWLRLQTHAVTPTIGELTIAIVGGGATGVELAAELRHSARQIAAYGFDRIGDTLAIKIVLIQSGPRILPELPERLAHAASERLRALDIEIVTDERVIAVDAAGLNTKNGRYIAAAIKVWAAGIRAPTVLAQLDGLEVNRNNQLHVHDTLQTTRDDAVFAFGDCAACPQPGSDLPVPPRAQAASQQAKLLAKSLQRRIAGRALPRYRYRDYGSLVSLGRRGTVGTLMGNLAGNYFVSGAIARVMYLSLYKVHQRALFGTLRVVLTTLANWLTRPVRPRLKLH